MLIAEIGRRQLQTVFVASNTAWLVGMPVGIRYALVRPTLPDPRRTAVGSLTTCPEALISRQTEYSWSFADTYLTGCTIYTYNQLLETFSLVTAHRICTSILNSEFGRGNTAVLKDILNSLNSSIHYMNFDLKAPERRELKI